MTGSEHWFVWRSSRVPFWIDLILEVFGVLIKARWHHFKKKLRSVPLTDCAPGNQGLGWIPEPHTRGFHSPFWKTWELRRASADGFAWRVVLKSSATAPRRLYRSMDHEASLRSVFLAMKVASRCWAQSRWKRWDLELTLLISD